MATTLPPATDVPAEMVDDGVADDGADVAAEAAPTVIHPLRLIFFGLLVGFALSGVLLWLLWRPVPATMTLQPLLLATPVEENVFDAAPLPASPEEESQTMTRSSAIEILSAGEPININRATPAELEMLPGIGTARARAIIDGRPYATIDDLDRVPGIGPVILEELRPLVSVD